MRISNNGTFKQSLLYFATSWYISTYWNQQTELIMKFLLLVASIMAQDYYCDALCTDASIVMTLEEQNYARLTTVLVSPKLV